jgi:hypothetical protein
MIENCRTFFKEVAIPVSNCLQNHFNNVEMAFLAVCKKMGNLFFVNLRSGALGQELAASLMMHL